LHLHKLALVSEALVAAGQGEDYASPRIDRERQAKNVTNLGLRCLLYADPPRVFDTVPTLYGWCKMTINGFRLWLAVAATTLLTVVLTLMASASGHVK
jgi:hypothetical protein